MSVQIEAGFKVMLDVTAAAEAREPAAMTMPGKWSSLAAHMLDGSWKTSFLSRLPSGRAISYLFPA